jgi:tetratricopeptide (TPR) repeat protein
MRTSPAPAALLFAATLAASVVLAPACASDPARTQLAFGLWASRNSLWDEAIFRWKKAAEADPSSAAAHNNLAVAYEKKGRPADALREYEEALKLDPGNAYVKSNDRNCKEISRPAEPDGKGASPPAKKSGPSGVGWTGSRVALDLPAAPAVDLKPYKEIVLFGFWQEQPVKDFDLDGALLEYWRDELEHPFPGRVTKAAILWEDGRTGTNSAFWRGSLPDPAGKLILTGTARFTRENRKSLVAGDRRELDDGPFAPVKPWQDRRVYSLKLEVDLIRPDSGEILFRKEFAENTDSDNPNARAEFAFYGLLRTVRVKLFRSLFGEERPQERFLLSR